MDTQLLENVVQETTRYDQFTLLEQNRTLSRNHIKRLIEQMEQDGNFTKTSPILVNGRLEVIDGQHRLEACRALGWPVYFTVVPGLTVHDARKMNAIQRHWGTRDYLRSYELEGKPVYIKLAALVEEYPNLKVSTILLFALGKYLEGASGYAKKFRIGEFPDFDMGVTRTRLDHLSELIEKDEAFNSRAVALAVLELMRSPDYDAYRMATQVSRTDDIRAYVGVPDNMRQLEEVYNRGFREGKGRVRLF